MLIFDCPEDNCTEKIDTNSETYMLHHWRVHCKFLKESGDKRCHCFGAELEPLE